MRIVSDFKDYYDVAGAYDSERDVIVEREQYEADLHLDKSNCHEMRRNLMHVCVWNRRGNFAIRYLYFCGEIYPLIEPRLPWTHLQDLPVMYPQHIPKDLNYLGDDDRLPADAMQELGKELKRQVQEEHPECFSAIISLPSNSYLRDNSGRIRLAISFNPLLKDLQFYRVLDPYSAYQTIDEFTGRNRGDKVIKPASDSELIQSKGYDSHSFRKESTGSKRINRKGKCN